MASIKLHHYREWTSWSLRDWEASAWARTIHMQVVVSLQVNHYRSVQFLRSFVIWRCGLSHVLYNYLASLAQWPARCARREWLLNVRSLSPIQSRNIAVFLGIHERMTMAFKSVSRSEPSRNDPEWTVGSVKSTASRPCNGEGRRPTGLKRGASTRLFRFNKTTKNLTEPAEGSHLFFSAGGGGQIWIYATVDQYGISSSEQLVLDLGVTRYIQPYIF